jgi:phosphoribosyl 1,2-cyclic phosphodiesterase
MSEGNFVKFLGTAGARFVVINQLRSSGGLWISVGGTNIYMDPGPGALVRCLSSRPKLNPSSLDGILLSHKHLDHSGDINVMIEAMTDGGFKKRGVLFVPRDALEDDPVVLRYVRNYVERVEVLREHTEYELGNICFSTAKRHVHSVETYGFNFFLPMGQLSLLTDTRFFPELTDLYPGRILIVSVVRSKPIENGQGIEHLAVDDVRRVISKTQPGLTVLTHFGMTMIRAKPWDVAKSLEEELGLRVIAARDGMTLNLSF